MHMDNKNLIKHHLENVKFSANSARCELICQSVAFPGIDQDLKWYDASKFRK